MPAHGRMRVVDIMPPKERERENTRRRTNSQVSLSDSLFLTSRRRSGESARSALSHRLEGRHLHQGPSVE